uniref:SCF ubiquitin ligase complex protein SKP1a n=1 Tax=Dictyostelium discoideum TaxID=44689 RepID=UPI00143F05A1|nr:Chain A, SCF ubiquitin ligase complex protein SKP1a [Dictyostelium discoideum]6V88_B Chain B, SCF ubiquitin ligase complex protein SKP1a [Dictyostelium discoideum]
SLVKLESSDEKVFEIEKEIACMSVTIKNMIEDIGESDSPIPLPNVTSTILEKVLDYCRHHHQHPGGSGLDDIPPYDRDFCKVDQPTLFELILAANYLDIKPLLDVTCKTVANMIRG